MQILIFAGTSNGRTLAVELANKGYGVTISSMSAHGNSLVPEHKHIKGIFGKMNQEDIEQYIIEHHIDAVIDATHPYAMDISHNIIKSTHEIGRPMIRYERRSSIGKDTGKHFDTYAEACEYLNNHEGNILFSTGVNHIDELVKLLDKKRMVVRILPVETSIQKAYDCGLQDDQIIALHPPYTLEDNLKHIRKYNIGYLVTKDSGHEGGTSMKLEAVKQAGIELIVIDRPKLKYPVCYYDKEKVLAHVYTLSK